MAESAPVPPAPWRSELIAQLEGELAEYSAFMQLGGVDDEHGGFFCALDHTGKRLDESKFIWYQGRGLWVYSHLARCHGGGEAALTVATKAFEFIRDEWKDEGGQWAVQTGAGGARTSLLRPVEPLSVGTSGYGGAFLAEGCLEYHRATGEPAALAMALAGLEEFVALVDDENHESDTHLPVPVVGSHCLGHAMILISLTRQLLEAPAVLEKGSAAEARVLQLSDRAVDEIDRRFFVPRFQLLGEVLDHSYTRQDDDNADFVYLGHGIETLWMLMAEALRREDAELYRRSAQRFRRHLEVAWDPIYGGVFRGLSVDSHAYLIDGDCKVKWAQDEAQIGCAMILKNAADEEERSWAELWLKRTRQWTLDKFTAPLRERSLPYVMVGGDRQAKFREHYVNAGQPGAKSRKEHYHHPRSLMLLAEILG